MSHKTERKEKICLNCGTALTGRYCHNCGQQNVPPQESVWHFTVHFVQDILHFDGKFFKTLKYLLFRPGFLTREYVSGRRVGYLDPIRMYLFSSFIFFLIYFSFNQTEPTPEEVKALATAQESIVSKNTANDSVYITGVNMFSGDFHTRAAYDSAAAVSPDPPGWLERKLAHREIEIENKYGNNEEAFMHQLEETLNHHFPQMLFVSLPLVALLLQLLYIRRKQFYYVAHGVFTIHLYIFLFFMLLIEMGLAALKLLPGWNWLRFVELLLFFLSIFYLYKAMRRFYAQKRWKTILKFLLFFFAFWIIILLIFLGFLLFTFFEV